MPAKLGALRTLGLRPARLFAMTADRRPFHAWPWRTIAVAALVAAVVAGWRPSGPATATAAVALRPDVDALARQLGGTPVGRALELRFPGANREAAEAEVRGGPPAARAVAWRLRQVALLTAPDALLDQHATLMRIALAAALDVEPSACSALLDGTLDTAVALPPPWRQADETFAGLLLSAPPRRGRPLRPGAAHRALLPVLLALTPAQQRLLGDPRAGRARCEAWRAWYDAAAALPGKERRLALRAALQR